MESNGPVSGKELALETGADHVLLLRLLRYLVAMHAVGEAGIDTYIPNNVTNNLAVPKLEAGVNHTYDVIGAAAITLPSFLARTKYQNPTDPETVRSKKPSAPKTAGGSGFQNTLKSLITSIFG